MLLHYRLTGVHPLVNVEMFFNVFFHLTTGEADLQLYYVPRF